MEGRTLRPLGVAEILDTAIDLYARNFATFAKIAAVIAVPMGVVVFLLDQIAFARPDGSADSTAYIGEYAQGVDYSTFTAVVVIESVVALFAFLLVIGASFRAVSELYAGQTAASTRSIGFAGGRVLPMLWIGMIFMLGVVAASFAFILPGIWLLVAWSLAIPVLLAEGLRGTKALGRSFELVRDNWWRTFGALLVGLIFIGLVQLILGFAGASLTSATDDSKTLSLLITDAVEVVSLIVTGPLQAAIVAVIYYDLRVRKDGFDVQDLTRQLELDGSLPPPGDASPPPPPPPSAPSGW